jgi:dolichol-phosphate mannosyltransferase
LPLSPNSGIFGLLDRAVVDELLRFPEVNRFLPGLRSYVGFKCALLPYDRAARHSGEPKQGFIRLVKYALDAVFSFSYKPLRVISLLGALVVCVNLTYACILTFMRVLGLNVVRGFTTPTVLILILGGLQLVSIGVLGEYIARIYDEVKRRPLYVVRRTLASGLRDTGPEGNPGVAPRSEAAGTG